MSVFTAAQPRPLWFGGRLANVRATTNTAAVKSPYRAYVDRLRALRASAEPMTDARRRGLFELHDAAERDYEKQLRHPPVWISYTPPRPRESREDLEAEFGGLEVAAPLDGPQAMNTTKNWPVALIDDILEMGSAERGPGAR